MDELISRRDTISAMEGTDWYHINSDGQLTHGANSEEHEPLYKAKDVYKVLNDMPPAQPEKRTEERTETHVCDLIDRQTAIDAILAVTGNSSVRELYEHVQEHGLSDMWSGGVNAAIDIIIAVPSVQTESKETSSTHKALDTISRQAAIRWVKTECNPYGKPTLDFESGKKVIEHLKQMPSAQPDMSEYSDKLWKRAYKRGRAEAHDEIVRCKDCEWFHDIGCAIRIVDDSDKPSENDYCSFAERKTDEKENI